MQILIIRHAIADELSTDTKASVRADEKRVLTRGGRRKMRRAAGGLRQLVPDITLLATSPLIRAVQTGQIIADAYDGLGVVQIAHLSPRKGFGGLLEWLNAQKPDSTIALVGHEPFLSTFACWMMTGLQESYIELKKGGALLLDVPKEVKAGRAKLRWAMKPSQLRKLDK